MLVIECRACGRKVREADAEWDAVSANGQCPECHTSFDVHREARAQELAADPQFVRRNTRARLVAAFAGITVTPLGIGLGLLHLGHLAHVVTGLGVAFLAGAVFLTPRRVARQDLAAPIDVERLARKDSTDERR